MINSSNWQETRKKGILQFIIVNGILLFGIPVTIATAVIRFYFGTPGTNSWSDYLLSNGTWIGFILQALISGVIFGAVIWYLNERTYNATTGPDSETEEV